MALSSLRLGIIAFVSSLALGCAGGLVAEDDAGVDAAAPPPTDASSDVLKPLDANDPCNNKVKDGTETDVDCGGSSCPKCGNGLHCGGVSDCKIPICTGGVCGACNGTTVCPIGQSCVAGFCRACTTGADCNGQVCNSGTCEPCKLTSECGTGEVCNYGTCTGGNQVSMYTCPGIVSLGGGAWGFYGCENQLTNTPTCYEIESPTTQTFNCTYTGKLSLVTSGAPPPAGMTAVQMYQCPGPVSLGGGAWGFYGCQNQITNTPTCYEIEYPTNKTFNCTAIGKMMVASAPPVAPPGGKNVPMYQCPGSVSLGGGAWGFYGCQSQLTNTTSCLEIESPTTQSFACPAAGNIVLEP
jgi:hypothetical protein